MCRLYPTCFSQARLIWPDSPRTKSIIPSDYSGAGCEADVSIVAEVILLVKLEEVMFTALK